MGVVEIRMLGPFDVRRADGSRVGMAEWRTGKTMDLVRLLALRPGTPVPTQALVDRLWPDVDRTRAHARLRTAVYQVRQTLGTNDGVERHFGALAVPASWWVDVVVYREVLASAQRAFDEDDMGRVVELVGRAEELYGGDFHAHDDAADWATTLRESLSSLRCRSLSDAAAAAVVLRDPRHAIRFAQAAIDIDPCAEAPHRSLMEAYAQTGEVDQALRVYEHCRCVLAEELGTDPSPLSQRVHVQVLRGEVEPVVSR